MFIIYYSNFAHVLQLQNLIIFFKFGDNHFLHIIMKIEL